MICDSGHILLLYDMGRTVQYEIIHNDLFSKDFLLHVLLRLTC